MIQPKVVTSGIGSDLPVAPDGRVVTLQREVNMTSSVAWHRIYFDRLWT